MHLTKSLLHTTDSYIKKLHDAGIETVRDFIMQFPRGYEDKSDVIEHFRDVNIKEKQAVKCKVELVNEETTRNKKLLIKMIVTDADGFHAECVWWNRRMILTQFAQGDTVIIFGQAKYEYGKLSWSSADIEHYRDKRREIVPVYSDVNYIPGTWIRDKMLLLRGFIREIPESIPISISAKHGFQPKWRSIEMVHFPSSIEDFDRAKKELGYMELYAFQEIGITKKYENIRSSTGLAPAIPLDVELMRTLIDGLPFALTDKQKIVLFQILKDMEKPHAMARLLQGDVGTGKTVVALLVAIHLILNHKKQYASHNPPERGGRGGSFGQGFLEYNRELTQYAQENRKEMNEPEKVFWYQILQQESLKPFHFRRQKPIGEYIVDFYSANLQLVIEIDGDTHLAQQEYDEKRTSYFEKQGIREIRFTNTEVIDTTEGVYEKLLEFIQSNPPVSPLSGGGNHIQVAIMAPTEILARQHFAGSESWLTSLGIRSDLLVGSLTPKQKNSAKERLSRGETDIIFGTHALIQEGIRFGALGFVVVDEQHRFGVEQRKALEEYCSGSGNRAIIPHRLNMSATPIPRTLALTLYGDQDIAVLDEYPAGRKPIHTRVVREDRRIEVYRFIEEEVRQGRQVYWISPLVEAKNPNSKSSQQAKDSEKIQFFGGESKEDIASAVEMQVTLSAVFPHLSIGLIHGKMSGKEKDRVMQDFYENKIQILSSTSVVEVGVNNPNATIICIEASERFGLSQLHQFRGRVGRGEHQSYCYLFTTKEYKTERLRAMEQTNDGFELAQIDLELRGPGEVYGVRQSGVPDFYFADLRDVNLIAEIREDIEELLQKL